MEDGKEKQTSQIKIKLNGVEKPFSEEARIHDWQKVMKEEAAATSDDTADDEDFDWVLPETENKEIPEYKIVNATIPRPRNFAPKNWRRNLYPGISKLVFSIILAIVVGIILGTIFLKMMASEDDLVAINEVENPGTTNNDEENGGTATGNAVDITVPALTIAVLQGGQFSTNEAAEAAANTFQNQDLATTVLEIDGKHYVFIGVAGDLSTAKSWESELKESGIEDVWAKDFTITEKSIAFSTQEKADQFVTEISMYKQLATESVVGNISGNIDSATIKETGENIGTEEGFYENEIANSLHSKLLTVQLSLANYEGSDNQENLVNAQQGLLDYMNILYRVGD